MGTEGVRGGLCETGGEGPGDVGVCGRGNGLLGCWGTGRRGSGLDLGWAGRGEGRWVLDLTIFERFVLVWMDTHVS